MSSHFLAGAGSAEFFNARPSVNTRTNIQEDKIQEDKTGVDVAEFQFCKALQQPALEIRRARMPAMHMVPLSESHVLFCFALSFVIRMGNAQPSWPACARLLLHKADTPSFTRHSVDVPSASAVTGYFLRTQASPRSVFTAHRLNAISQQVAETCQTACPPQPTLVYSPIGGLGDRLKGLATAYFAALLTHARFRVAWTAPYRVDEFFEVRPDMLYTGVDAAAGSQDYNSGFYQIRIPGATTVEIKDNFAPFEQAGPNFPVRWAGNASCNGTQITILRTNARSWVAVVRHPALRPVADAYGLTGLSSKELFALAMDAVLRWPKASLVHGVAQALPLPLSNHALRSMHAGESMARIDRRRTTFLNWAGHGAPHQFPNERVSSLVAVQIRTGGIGEAWVDSRLRHPLESVHCFVTRATEVCRDMFGGACVVYVTADSQVALNTFVRHMNGTAIPVVQAAGPILHTDRPIPKQVLSASTTKVSPWLKTFIDWTTLSLADVVLASNGGFGMTAAVAGSAPVFQQLRLGQEDTCAWDG